MHADELLRNHQTPRALCFYSFSVNIILLFQQHQNRGQSGTAASHQSRLIVHAVTAAAKKQQQNTRVAQ